jgi:hypothetical protein
VKRIAAGALCLWAALGAPPPAAAVPGLIRDAPAGPAVDSLVVPVQRRCVPSRCTCRDCRRDRLCSCIHGKYVCSLYVSG